MTPTVVYRTSYPCVKRRFELSDDSIRVVGTKNFVDFDITLPLARLDSQFERLRIHNQFFYTGYWLLLAAVVLLLAFATFVEMQDERVSFGKPFGLIGGLGAMGLAVALLNRRKVEHVQFRTEAGVAILAVPHGSGPSGEFDRFVGLIVERIHKARGEALLPEPVPGET